MFTGIVEATGTVKRLRPAGGDWRLSVASRELDLSDVKAGDSIAVSGVCLTVTHLEETLFQVDVSAETMKCTTLGDLKPGDAVNLEKALTLQSRLGGHLVSGHVDGVGEVAERRREGRSERFIFSVSPTLSRYIAAKGSVCIDGVSLTVNETHGDSFTVNIIPHTAHATTLGQCRAGSRVNVEVDLVSRYVERLLQREEAAELDMDLLEKNGFVSR